MKKRRLYAVINIVALSLLALLVGIDYFNQGIVYMMVNDAQSFQQVFQSKELWFQIAAILGLIIIEVIIGIIPGHLVYPIIGVLVHPFFGGVLIVIGNIIGSIANYYQGKILSSGLSKKEIDEKRSFIRKIEDGGAKTLFLLRLNPLTSLDILSYFAGAIRMKFWPFLIANTLGLMPIIFLETYAADTLFTEYTWIWQILVVMTVVWIVYEIVKTKKKVK